MTLSTFWSCCLIWILCLWTVWKNTVGYNTCLLHCRSSCGTWISTLWSVSWRAIITTWCPASSLLTGPCWPQLPTTPVSSCGTLIQPPFCSSWGTWLVFPPLALCDFSLKLMLFNWSLIFPSGISSLLPHPYLQEEQMIDGFALSLFVMMVGTLPASLMTGKIMQTLSYLLLKTQHWSFVLQLVACIKC